jgi:general secretion pathway protein D
MVGAGAMRLALALVFILVSGVVAQSAQDATPQPDIAKTGGAKKQADKKQETQVETGGPVQAGTLHAQRKAAKHYLQGVKLLEKQQPEAAWDQLKQAVALDPGNLTYSRAAELARQSTVTQLVQEASREHLNGAGESATALLQHALQIDPTNPSALEHLNGLAEETAGSPVGTTSSQVLKKDTPIASDLIQLEPSQTTHSFHLRSVTKQVVQDVFKAYGVTAYVDNSVEAKSVRLDVDDASFPEAMRVLSLLTGTFWEALDPHRAIVAKDTRANRQQYQRTQMETVYLPGLTDKDLTDVSNLARNVFDAQQAVAEPSAGTLTLRAPANTINAFNQTIAQLEDGKSQVDLDVKVIQLAHVSSRETGTTFFQQTGVYNAFSEIQSILSQNQAAVQQIIASGLVPNANTLQNQLAILFALLASGQLTGPPFNQGFLPFGGGLTQSFFSPGPATLTMTLNSSDTRTLDDIHLRLGDDEKGTFKVGQRYPIETSSFSSASLPNIPGLSAEANAAQSQVVPQVQYQDIGLTLTATPKVMRSNDVALTLELKISSLGGAALNDIPILNNQEFSGVVTLRAGETAVMVHDLNRQESRALSGLPGVSDIPGLQDISDIQRNQNVARLLILLTPSVVRGTQQLKRGQMLMVDKTQNAH